ncbi:MAG: hypothetical protein IH987_21195, partial [Planctomycetes bacterium]|nr:hypothetical protein [Planctomycetota bacterium]
RTETLIASQGDLSTGVWTHAAAVYDGRHMILYKDGSFISNTSVLDFVCWGSPSPSRRLNQGAGSGKWSGSCAASIQSGAAIHRIAGTDGTSAASYDVNAPPSPMTCIP